MPTPVTRTLVALFAFTEYLPEDASAEGLETLSHTAEAHARLREMYASARYRDAGFELIEIDAGSNKASVEKALKSVASQVRSSTVPVCLLMIWSGHGKTFDRMLRLATPECTREFERDEGLPVSEVLVQVGARHCDSFAWILDCCEAGAAVAEIAAEVTQQAWAGGQGGIAAFFSSQAYERGFDGAAISLWHQLLAVGPSREVREVLAAEFGDPFNPNNKLLWPEQLGQVVFMEVERLRQSGRQVSIPNRFSAGRPARLFLNPEFRREITPALVADRYAARVSRVAVETHFLPKARGIEVADRGWRFTGRVEATRKILEWRSDTSGKTRNLYLLVADGGTGKSALIGRLVALADANYRAQVAQEGWHQTEDEAAGTVPPVDAFSAAVHLRQLSTDAAANEVARLLELPAHETVERTVEAAKHLAQAGHGIPPCIVFDALDEADAPVDTALRLVRALAFSGWRVLVATRPSASARGGEALLKALGSTEDNEIHWLDRDAGSAADIEAYCQARLNNELYHQLASDENMRRRVSQRIAALANGKFLFARMACSSLLREMSPIDDDALERLLARGIGGLFGAFVGRLDVQFQQEFQVQMQGATATLRALSFALGHGLPLRDGLWREIAASLLPRNQSDAFTEQHLRWLFREAGEFIVEDGDGEQAVYRLYHQALVDYWQGQGDRPEIMSVLADHVARVGGWHQSNPYVVAFSAQHALLAQRNDVLEAILLDIDWIEARLSLSGMVALLADYGLLSAGAGRDPMHIGRVLRLVADVLAQRPEELRAQLVGRISGETPAMARFLQAIRVGMRLPALVAPVGWLRQPGELMQTLRGHEGSVNSVAWRADGQRLVSGSSDATLQIWDAESGALLRTLRGHGDAENSAVLKRTDGKSLITEDGVSLVLLRAEELTVNIVAWSVGGQHIFSGGGDTTVRVWDAESGALLHTLRGHEKGVTCIASRADGERLVSGSWDSTLRVWDVKSGALLHTLRGHQSGITSVSWHADELRLVSQSIDSTFQVWDAENGLLVHTSDAPGRGFRVAAWSPDGQRCVFGCEDNALRVLDNVSDRPPPTLRGHEQSVTCVSWRADGQLFVSGSEDKTLRVWDADSGALLHTLRGHQSRINSVAWRADGQRLASGSQDGTLRVWDAGSVALPHKLRGHESRIEKVVWSADGQCALSESEDGALRLWDAHSGALLQTLHGHEYRPSNMGWRAFFKRLISRSEDSVRWFLDMTSGETPRLAMARISGSSFPGMYLVLPGRVVLPERVDGALRVWNWEGRVRLHTLRGHKDEITAVAWRADGNRLVSGSKDKTLRIWDLEKGRLLHTLRGHQHDITVMVWRADGKRLVSGSGDRTLRVWDAESGKLIHTLHGHESWITAVAWCADGHRLASGGEDDTMRVWDAESGALLHTLHGNGHCADIVAWRADGRHLVSGGRDNTLRVWDTTIGKCVACLTLDASITSLAVYDEAAGLRLAVGDAAGDVVIVEFLEPNQSATATT